MSMAYNTSPRNQKLIALAIVALPLIGALTAFYFAWNTYFFPADVWLLVALYVITTMGVTIGYHRMLTHDGFKAPEWLRGLFLIAGCMAWEGYPLDWTATHVKHHAHSDEEGDPHSPLEGFWHAHFGWLFTPKSFADPAVYTPHLLQDKTVMFVNRHGAFWMLLALVIPFAIGGWTGLLWGGFVRIFLTTHVTWSVNSICHMFGKREFETTDESRNEWVIGLLGLGEGWHNNHHAFPRNAFHGMRWWQVDMSGLVLKMLEAMGLIWDVQRVSQETQDAHRIKSLSMQEHLHELRAQLSEKIRHAQVQFMSMIEFRGTPNVTAHDIDAMVSSCEQSLRRLSEIQLNVTKASHLKKQKLVAYIGEVQRLCDEAKLQASRMVMLRN